jgi:hypothetical protein
MGIMVAPADLSRPIPQGRRTATVGEMEVKPTRHRAPSTPGTTPPVR